MAEAFARALARALDASANIVGLYDADDWLLYANRAYADTFLKGPYERIRFEDVLRRGFHGGFGVKIDSGDVEAFLRDIVPRRRALAGSRAIQTDTVDGRWLHITETRLADGGLLSIASDITRLKHDERTLRQSREELAATAAELRRSNAELEQFAYAASHDLQEPLRTIGSYAQLLARRHDAPAAQRAEYLGFITAGVARMQRLIDHLLAYARVGSAPLHVAESDLGLLLGQAVANLEGAIRDAGARVTHDALPVVRCDGAQIAQVLQNLIGNAVKFSRPAAPRVHVSARREGGDWIVAVRDEGIGIEPEQQGKLFGLFQRIEPDPARGGTGIGLATSKKIVERHGGRIGVESAGRGRGATFYFTLPA